MRKVFTIAKSCAIFDKYRIELYTNSMYIVYCFTNTLNGKKYIGQTNNYTDRMSQHRRFKGNSCPRFYNSLRKYGWNNFTIEIWAKDLTKELADWFESAFIQMYCTYDERCGYNRTFGGDGVKGLIHTEETKKKISDMQKEGGFTKGRKRSPEEIQMALETRIRNDNLKHTPESKKKMSESKQKEKHNFWGKERPVEVKENISLGLGASPAILYNEKLNLEDLVIVRALFAKKHSLDVSKVCSVVTGERKSHKGWKLKRVVNLEDLEKEKQIYGIS